MEKSETTTAQATSMIGDETVVMVPDQGPHVFAPGTWDFLFMFD